MSTLKKWLKWILIGYLSIGILMTFIVLLLTGFNIEVTWDNLRNVAIFVLFWPLYAWVLLMLLVTKE